MQYEFKLPDIGEGLSEGEVVKWHVREGDAVIENQPLINVLTDKAEVEIPSPKSGRIVKLLAAEGQKVPVHAGLVLFELDGAAAGPDQSPGGVNALPAVRKLAADLRVDLGSLRGTGPGGRVTADDVRGTAGGPRATPSAPASPATAPDDEESVPFTGVRRRTAEKMASSKRIVAHVTHMDEADCTALVGLREELKPEARKRALKLTVLTFVVKALCGSLKRFPNLNSVLDEAGGRILRKRRCNIGFATAAEQGLLVPVIQDAGAKDLWALAGEIQRLSGRARANRAEAPELRGGTFTVTNIGSIGGLFATPIVNHPEVGILGIMKLHKRPMVKDGAVAIRDILPLVLSFDHRVLDGAEAAHFMNHLIGQIESPRALLS